MLIVSIVYIIGTLVGLYFKNIAPFFVLVFIIFLWGVKGKRKAIIFYIIFVIAISTAYYTKQKYNNLYTGIKNVKVVAEVTKELEGEKYYKKYVVTIKEINGSTKQKNSQVFLYVSPNNKKIEFGNLIELQGEFSLPEQSRNYKGFDYSKYLRAKKIYGIIFVKDTPIKIIKTKCNKVTFCLNQVITKIRKFLKDNLPPNNYGICMAMLFGDRLGLEDSFYSEVSEVGASHVLAISGMHVMYVVVIFNAMFKKCGSRLNKFFTIVGIMLYICFLDSSESITRAVVMTNMNIIAKLFFRKSDAKVGLALASLVCIILNPYAICSISFLLSFGATIGIIILSPYVGSLLNFYFKSDSSIIRYIKSNITISISANVVILPVLVSYFNQINIVFLISNILISLIMPILFPVMLITAVIAAISTPLAFIFCIVLKFSLNIFCFVIDFLSKLSFFNILVRTPSVTKILFYYISIFSAVKIYTSTLEKRKVEIKKFICLFCIIIVYFVSTFFINLVDTNTYIHFIDVGQGDGTLIITPAKKKILVDGGGKEQGEDDVGKKTLLPYLLDRGIFKLDYLMISHFDSDHCKAALYVMRKIKVKNVIISKQAEKSNNFEELKTICSKRNINVIVVKNGDNINIDKESYFKILFPNQKLITKNKLNNNSIVAKFISNDVSVLFTGDIEKEAEDEIVKQKFLKSDILKVAHHGSRTSTSIDFINKVKPRIALIGVGKDNKFGHPSDEVIKRISNLRAKIYRTDLCGEITIIIDKNSKFKINCWIKKE